MAHAGLHQLSPEMRFLVACCRLRPHVDVLRAAAKQVTSWSEVSRLASHHLIAPLVHLHCVGLGEDVIPGYAAAALSLGRKDAARKSLLQQAQLRQIAEKHLRPRNISYLAFKGLTLGARYYGDPALRQCRDIDLLIDPAHLYDLTADLLGSGYRLRSPYTMRDEDDLRAHCEMNGDVGVFSPLGVLIELHHRLDFTGCQYPVEARQLFERVEPVLLSGDAYPALPTVELFIYICYHNSKHQWSRLLWIADLDAIISHETFDREMVLARAEELGLSRLVRAALFLYEILYSADLGITQPAPDAFARVLVNECLFYLQEESAPPEVVNKVLGAGARGMFELRAKIFVYNWRANTRWANRLCYLLSIARSTYADYRFLPLPRRYHFAYCILRPLRWMLESLGLKRVGVGHSVPP